MNRVTSGRKLLGERRWGLEGWMQQSQSHKGVIWVLVASVQDN